MFVNYFLCTRKSSQLCQNGRIKIITWPKNFVKTYISNIYVWYNRVRECVYRVFRYLSPPPSTAYMGHTLLSTMIFSESQISSNLQIKISEYIDYCTSGDMIYKCRQRHFQRPFYALCFQVSLSKQGIKHQILSYNFSIYDNYFRSHLLIKQFSK